MRIACLHTVDSNIAVFEAAVAALPGVTLTHHVRTDLLIRAEAAGHLTDEIRDETADFLRELASGVDAVLFTCSTVGPAAERADLLAAVPILRVDGALASAAIARAAAGKGHVDVLCAVKTTIEPTHALFERMADGTEVTIKMHLAPGAWDAFRAGDIPAYHRLVAEAADRLYAVGAEIIALAQASMAGAAALCTRGTPLTSPAPGLAAAARS